MAKKNTKEMAVSQQLFGEKITASNLPLAQQALALAKQIDLLKESSEAQKKAAEARKKQKVIEVKEVKMRPNIDQHDYEVKMRSVNRFLDAGDKVKLTLRFRGREMAHQELGLKVLYRVRDEVAEISKVEQHPKMEGRQMTMVIAPIK